MKTCTLCKQTLDESAFSKASRKKDGLQSHCKTCHNQYAKVHYKKNRTRYRALIKAGKRRVRDSYMAEKSKASCTDCGASYPQEPWLMEYDHLGDKTKAVSTMVSHGKCPIEEIKKCEIVCIICHRRRTAKRAGWTFST